MTNAIDWPRAHDPASDDGPSPAAETFGVDPALTSCGVSAVNRVDSSPRALSGRKSLGDGALPWPTFPWLNKMTDSVLLRDGRSVASTMHCA